MALPAFSLSALVLFLASSYQNTISLGSIIIGILVAVLTLVTAIYGIRYRELFKASLATSNLLEEERDVWREKAERLDAEHLKVVHLLAEAQKSVAKLEALPNLERVVVFMGEIAERQDKHASERLERGLKEIKADLEEVFSTHEVQANRRLAVLKDEILKNRKEIREQ